MNEGTQYHLILLSVLIMIVLASSVILIFYYYNKKVINALKDAHLKEIDYQNKLLSSTINTQEQERARIARDLHDDIGSKLNIINLNFNLLTSAISNKTDYSEILRQIGLSLDESIERSRSISHDLLPPILTKFGLQSAINSLASKINKTGEIDFTCGIAEDWGELSLKQELHTYRVVQELVNNTIKHAKAKQIMITSKVSEDKISLFYVDDGVGMDKDEIRTGGLGFDNMKIRVQLMKGRLDIISALNEGMKVTIDIPYN